MPSTWCHCIKMSLKCLHSRSTSYSHQYLVRWSQCKKFISYSQWSRCAGINTCGMLSFKEPHKPVSFQTKSDFIAWLQEEHISEVLASEATHRPAMVSRILSQYCLLANERQSPAASYHWESFSHLESYRCFVSSDRMFSYPCLLSSSQEKRKHFNPLNKSLRWWHKSKSVLSYTYSDYIKEVALNNIF